MRLSSVLGIAVLALVVPQLQAGTLVSEAEASNSRITAPVSNQRITQKQQLTTPKHIPRRVTVSIAQLGDPLSVISQGCIEVNSLLGSGTDPHLYRLSRADVLQLHESTSLFYVGDLLEAQMEDILDSMSEHKPVFAVTELLDAELLQEVGPNMYDPHLWMDPLLWGQALAEVSNALIQLYPECRQVIMAGLDDYLLQLEQLHAKAQQVFAAVPPGKRVLVTSHDAFGYFGDRYGLKVMAVQGISTDRQISLSRLNNLVDYLVENDIDCVFVESSVNARDIEALIAGAKSRGHNVAIGGMLYSDAMGREGTKEGTYLGMLAHNVRTIAMVLLPPESQSLLERNFSPTQQ